MSELKPNNVVVVGLVIGVAGLIMAGAGLRAVTLVAGFVALGCGIAGDVLTRRGYSGGRLGVATILLGMICIAAALMEPLSAAGSTAR